MFRIGLFSFFMLLLTVILLASGCQNLTQEDMDRRAVNRQQSQYGIGQPVPQFDWSLERHLVAELYRIRNKKVATHSVWRSDFGTVEGDCPSIGFGIPYDTSLTNPLRLDSNVRGAVSIEQAEPNGIFASKNTSATWVMCVSTTGSIEPVYVESKVTVYPGPVEVDYENNIVYRKGKATVQIKVARPLVK